MSVNQHLVLNFAAAAAVDKSLTYMYLSYQAVQGSPMSQHTSHIKWNFHSGVGTGGSGGSMNRGPRATGAPE